MAAIDFVSLRLLVAVGSTHSLGRSARDVGISQPAASKRISLLERQFGLDLLERGPSGSRLTSHGETVAQWASEVLQAVDQLRAGVTSLRAASAASLRIAASMTIAEHLIPRWLADLQTSHPELHVGLEVANSAVVQEHVLHGQADIGFVEGPNLESGLASQPVARDRLVVVVSPGHPWSRRRHIRRSEFLNTPLVVREEGSGTRATLERVLGNGNAAPALLELGSNEAVKGTVEAGAGPAVLSVLAVEREIEAGRLHEVEIQSIDLGRDLHAVWPAQAPLKPSALWLLYQIPRQRKSAR